MYKCTSFLGRHDFAAILNSVMIVQSAPSMVLAETVTLQRKGRQINICM